MKIQRILVPVDFSAFSDRATKFACEFAEKFEAELHLLHVVTDATLMYTASESMMAAQQVIQQEEEHTLDKLELLPAEPWQSTLKIRRSVKLGVPITEILRYAKTNEIDLIIMGTHGRTGLRHVLLGSVAEKVVRKAPCAVLTVRDPEHLYEAIAE